MNIRLSSVVLASLRIPRHSPTLGKRMLRGGFMFAGRSRKFQFGLTLATALSFSVLPAASQAYTPEQQQACTGDAFRLCGAEIPDIERVKVCMIRNQSQLSPGCRAHFRPDGGPSVTPVGAGRPLTVKPARAR